MKSRAPNDHNPLFLSVIHVSLFAVFAAALALAAIWNGQPVHAAAFTSTQSGSWGSASTWGGAGVPGAGDDVTIATGTTVTQDANRSVSNLTINTGGTLNGGNAGTFFHASGANIVNNGSLAVANFTFTGGTQTLSGTGTFTSATMDIFNGSVTTLGNDMTISVGSFFVDGGGTLSLSTNSLTFDGGSFTKNNSGTVTGTGTFLTQGTPTLTSVAGATFSAPLEINSGTTTINTSAVAGSISILSGATLQVGASQSVAAGGDVSINSGGTLSGGNASSTFAASGANIVNNGSVTVANFNFTGSAQTLSGAGNFSSNTVTIFNGSTTIIGSNHQLSRLVINGGGTFDISNRTLLLSGVGTPLTILNSGTFITTGSTIVYNGATAQTVATVSVTYNNLTTNNAAGVTLPAAITVPGTLTLSSGALSIGANTLTLNGAISSSGGTLTGGNTSNIAFGGSGASTALPTVTNGLGNLTINRGSGVALGADLTVNGVLTLTSGDLTTGSFTLTMPSGATSGPAANASDVVGNVLRTGFTTGGGALSFGNPFNTIQVTSGVAPANINVNLVKSVPTGAIGYPNAVARTYTITPSASGFTATLRLHYLDAELNLNAEADLNLWRFDSGLGQWRPNPATSRNASDNWVEKTAVTQFSPWTLNSTNSPTASPASIGGILTNPDGSPQGGVVLHLTGGRRTITRADGKYQFENVNTGNFYTLTPLLANHHFSPASRSFSLTGNLTDANFAAGANATQDANPLDMDMYFVRQQYLDILGREPDEGGLQYWTAQISGCPDDERLLQCTNARRVDVAAAFFIALEFQQSGSFIYDVYSGTLGRQPAYVEYAADRQQVIGGANLDEEKDAFAQPLCSGLSLCRSIRRRRRPSCS